MNSFFLQLGNLSMASSHDNYMHITGVHVPAMPTTIFPMQYFLLVQSRVHNMILSDYTTIVIMLFKFFYHT